MKKIILLSDTHSALDERFLPHLEDANEIWHAGDIGDIGVLENLEKTTKALFCGHRRYIDANELTIEDCLLNPENMLKQKDIISKNKIFKNPYFVFWVNPKVRFRRQGIHWS